MGNRRQPLNQRGLTFALRCQIQRCRAQEGSRAMGKKEREKRTKSRFESTVDCRSPFLFLSSSRFISRVSRTNTLLRTHHTLLPYTPLARFRIEWMDRENLQPGKDATKKRNLIDFKVGCKGFLHGTPTHPGTAHPGQHSAPR